ncbi:MAG: succinylglutamate desuccinylase/aspartoacylase family protein [Acaryochloridaceae cyanobacterium SU_2_1]|nr:succinylglutamate desuccinylase/aspartoacylase family protein [Acaryochloridaceae cyanobacterium SU_2_1]
MTDITIGGVTVAPGTDRRIELPIARLITQTMLSLPVRVINGSQDGPHLWLSAAIHGDELNGVEIIRQVLAKIKAKKMRGALLAVPIVNVFGFLEQSRYLPDRRDLNRSFPGSVRGSLAARLAHLFMKEIVSHSSHGIDLHTASHHRTNFPQIRANLDDPETYRCARAFGAPLMIHATTRDGSLRQAAAQKGISVLLYEAGEAQRFDAEAIQQGVAGILQVMVRLGMLEEKGYASPPKDSIEIRETKWVRSPRSGILHRQVGLGQSIKKRQELGYIVDATGDRNVKVQSPTRGIVIGCTQNPLVNQGDGIVHLGVTDLQL